MRDYKRMSVYVLLERLLCDVFQAVRVLPPSEQPVLGREMRQAISRSMFSLVHGAMTKNSETFLPYLEESHAFSEEFGQYLRICRMWNLLPPAELELLTQRQESCSRLLLQMRRTILLSEEERRVEKEGGVWVSAVADCASENLPAVNEAVLSEPKRRPLRPKKTRVIVTEV